MPPASQNGQSHAKLAVIKTAALPSKIQASFETRAGGCSSATAPPQASELAEISGASTGAAHGTGSRKSTSQSNTEAGQPSKTFSHP